MLFFRIISTLAYFFKELRNFSSLISKDYSALRVINLSFSVNVLYIDFKSYVYWTVHHLDSWIKETNLMSLAFFTSLFNAQHVSDVNTSILRSLRLICWVISWIVLLWYDACRCYVVLGRGGVVSGCRLNH